MKNFLNASREKFQLLQKNVIKKCKYSLDILRKEIFLLLSLSAHSAHFSVKKNTTHANYRRHIISSYDHTLINMQVRQIQSTEIAKHDYMIKNE